tara:strand:- start:55 stop:774 length:720 start_codon:yes stop_codon:yes gene_type:complete
MNKNGTIRDKYLYFGLDSAASEAFANTDCSGAVTLTLNTSNFDNPTPDGVNFIANGGMKVEVVAHANHSFGTSYANVDTSAGVTVDISRSCTYHATSGAISITLVATDAVDGFTGDTSTANNNDFTVTQLKPYLAGNGFVYNSRYLQGMHYQTATTTELHFQGKTGDVGATSDVDTITVTHGSQKHKEFMRDLLDVIADDNKVNGMVVVCDDMPADGTTVLTAQNASVIASVAQTATAS